ncbi:hypothetical protein ABE42_41660 [Bacillus thuringiensis]|nr:hypothetical protein [Bacillus thuringiensis]
MKQSYIDKLPLKNCINLYGPLIFKYNVDIKKSIVAIEFEMMGLVITHGEVQEKRNFQTTISLPGGFAIASVLIFINKDRNKKYFLSIRISIDSLLKHITVFNKDTINW